MTATRRRFNLPPRIMSEGELATYLGRGTTWLRNNRERLEAMGMPQPLPGILGGYDRHAVDEWLDRLGGRIDPVRDGADALVRAAANG